MRLAFVSTMDAVPWGGSEELWSRAAGLAVTRGHAVYVSVVNWGVRHPTLEALERAGATVHVRGSRRRALRAGELRARRRLEAVDLLRSGVSLACRLAAFRPHVVCVSQGGTYDLARGEILRRVLRTIGAPYVVIAHFNEDAVVLSNAERDVAREVLREARRVLFVAERNWRATERQLASAIPNASVIRNPVDGGRLSLLPPPTGATPNLAVVGRLQCLTKGQDVLLEALGARAWRGRAWRLNLYGTGPDEEYLRELTMFYGLGDRIRFHGQVDDIRTAWALNHLALVPSRAEGTPHALVEAMYCGRPAVATDVGGNADLVQEHVTGFLAEAPSAASLGAALERAWRCRERWEALGRDAHECVRAVWRERGEAGLLDTLTSSAG